jgi:16S rRNA G966 N2-methylase RsmD
MPDPLQAEAVLAAMLRGRHQRPKTVSVAFRSENGSVGKRDYLTHWIHSYPAKMFRRIPQAILGQLPSQPKLTILDPFCGSGTVLLEAVIRGHDAIGIDINPLARLISRVKVTPICPKHLKRHLAGILRRAQDASPTPTPDTTLDFWFKSGPLQALKALERSISRVEHQACREFFLVCFSSIVRKASLADPTIPPPVKLNPDRAAAANERYRQHLRSAQNLTTDDVYKLFQNAVASNLQRMNPLFAMESLGKTTILSGSQEAAKSDLPEASVDIVLTSPPYCGAQKYVRSLRLEMLLLGNSPLAISEVDRTTLGTERLSAKLDDHPFSGSLQARRIHKEIRSTNITRASMFAQYTNYLCMFAAELGRLLKPGGQAFVTFGTDRIAGIEVDFSQLFAKAAIGVGMIHVATLVDTIPSRGMITNRHISAATIKDERVVWIRR